MNDPGVERRLPIEIRPQPDLTSCGPTCLQAVYQFFGDDQGLDEVRSRVGQLSDGGTLAVMLAIDALERGYRAIIHTFNLTLFDPTWFQPPAGTSTSNWIIDRLAKQASAKGGDGRLQVATRAYSEFLRLGGQLRWGDLTRDLIHGHLSDGVPILTGLSSTYLYQEAREVQSTMAVDDVAGEPTGHFVILSGFDEPGQLIHVSDPFGDNPLADEQHYLIPVDRVICAILLGVLTYDANFLIIEPSSNGPEPDQHATKKVEGPK